MSNLGKKYKEKLGTFSAGVHVSALRRSSYCTFADALRSKIW